PVHGAGTRGDGDAVCPLHRDCCGRSARLVPHPRIPDGLCAGAMIPPHLLALIPGCEEGVPPTSVQPLPGGRGCNVVLRVDTEAGTFVLRQRHTPLDRPGAVALTELRSQMAAASAGLAPRIIQAAVDG